MGARNTKARQNTSEGACGAAIQRTPTTKRASVNTERTDGTPMADPVNHTCQQETKRQDRTLKIPTPNQLQWEPKKTPNVKSVL